VVFDAAAFLGELREGLPGIMSEALRRNAKNFFSGTGKDYLNLEFGWKPFIRDLQNAAKALMGATDMLAQQGQRVHRKMSLPPTERSATMAYDRTLSVVVPSFGGFATKATSLGNSSTQTSGGTGRANLLKSATTTRWFEGEFSSFYPLGFDPNDYAQRLGVLLNPKITPATLWQLAPWSWLVDWNLRIGDSIEANEKASNDLLVMHYGYAMETTVYKTNVNWRLLSTPNSQYSTWTGFPTWGRYKVETVYKRRLRANPYGFRAGGADALNGGQIAILGALGLTKTR
jgi:hypothetical protein